MIFFSHSFLLVILNLEVLTRDDTRQIRTLETQLPPTTRVRSHPRDSLPPTCTNRISIAHKPRYDLTGSFTLPTILLLAIAHRYNWKLEIAPFAGSTSANTLKGLIDLGPKLQDYWPTESSGMGDASNRKDFDPIALNTEVYGSLGIFPSVSTSFNESEWLQFEEIPSPGQALEEICGNHTQSLSSTGCATTCRLFMSDNPIHLQRHMLDNGGYDTFFTESLRDTMFQQYSKTNRHRLSTDYLQPKNYNVAIHVRRGEILSPTRWTSQSTFATVARHVCSEQRSRNTTVHIFSSGKNRDGNWTELENVADTCNNVIFHLDEYEFDTWAHFVFADELVLSKSTFSYVPALISAAKVHSPDDSWHIPLPHWKIFRNSDGAAIR